MEEALKAGHVLEPDRDMQFCAKVIEVDDASSVNRRDFCIVDRFVYLEEVEDVFCSRSRMQVIRGENLSWRKFHPATTSLSRPSSCPAFSLLLAIAPVMSRIPVD